MAEDKSKLTKTNEPEEKSEKILINNESVHNQSLDINENLGSFSANDPSNDPNQAINDEIVISKKANKLGSLREDDKKVDFEKFKKVKKSRFAKIHNEGKTNNVFFIKIDTWLRNNRSLLIIWMIIIGVITFVLSLAIALPITLSLDKKSAPSASYFNFSFVQSMMNASNIMNYMAIAFTVAPLMYLLITILVGINGVYRARNFHVFFWICLCIAIVLVITAVSMSSYIVCMHNAFNPPV